MSSAPVSPGVLRAGLVVLVAVGAVRSACGQGARLQLDAATAAIAAEDLDGALDLLTAIPTAGLPRDEIEALDAALWRVARTAAERDRYATQIRALKARLPIVRGLHDGPAEAVATTLTYLGTGSSKAGALPEVEACYREALAIRQALYRRPTHELAQAHCNLGHMLTKRGAVDEAEPHLRIAIEMWREVHPGAHQFTAIGLINLGACLTAMGETEEALLRSAQALAMYRSVMPDGHPELVLALGNQGQMLIRVGRVDDALTLFEEAHRMAERLFRGDHPVVVIGLRNLAHGLRHAGRFDAAIDHAQRAAAMSDRFHGRDHVETADCLHELTRARLGLGRAAEAVPVAERVLAIRRLVLPPGAHLTVEAYSDLLECVTRTAEFVRAEAIARELVTILEAARPADDPDLATARFEHGFLLRVLGRAADALPQFEAVLATRVRTLPDPHAATLDALLEVARCLDAGGQTDAALSRYESARDMALRLGPDAREAVAVALSNIALCKQRLGRPEAGVADAERALEIWRAAHPHGGPSLTAAKSVLARLYARLGRVDDAERLAVEAVVSFERGRALATSRDALVTPALFADLDERDPYRGLQAVLLDRGRDGGPDPAAALLEAFERRRAAAWADVVARTGYDPVLAAAQAARTGADDARADELLALAAELGALGEAFEAPVDPARADVATAATEAALRVVLDARAAIVGEVLPFTAAARAAAIQAALEPGELLLAWVPTDADRSHVLVVAPDDVRAVPIRAAAGRIRELVDTRLGAADVPADARREAAAELFSILLPADGAEPLWDRVRAAQRVFVVPHGALARLTFEELVVGTAPDGAPRHWLDDGPGIAYLPSATALGWLRGRARRGGDQRDPAGRGIVTVGVAGAAEGTPGGTVDSAADVAADGAAELAQLRGALVARFGATGVRALSGARVPADAIWDAVADAAVLHVAAPAVADELGPVSRTRLELDAGGPDADGVAPGRSLRLRELLDRRAGGREDLELVWLSAVRTVVGVDRRDEAPLVLPLGFLHAGARAVVASGWVTGPDVRVELATAFHAQTQDGDALAAFVAARRALRATHPDPRAWAAFRFHGVAP